MFTTATKIDVIKIEAATLAREWDTTPEFENKKMSRSVIISDDVSNHYQVQTNNVWVRINVFF